MLLEVKVIPIPNLSNDKNARRTYFSFVGPETGRYHNLTLYRDSSMKNLLQQSLLVWPQKYYKHGDPAYVLLPWLQEPINRTFASPAEHIVNTTLSAVRVSV